MKILYAVQGTGNGHIARARVMADAFAQRDDIEVDFLFSGRPEQDYFDMQVFGDFRCYKGLTFITANGKVQKWQTFRQADITQLVRDIKHLDLSQYDVVLNDFEPISAWAARREQVACISVSHQAAFAFPVPRQGDNFLDRALTKYFAPGNIQLGVHWYHFGHTIIPPFIQEQPVASPDNLHVLVYLPFEELSAIETLLSAFPDQPFMCFHPRVNEDSESGNISWRRTSKPKFLEAIKQCSGVIANAGFELSSECLHLGKKVLTKPLRGQYEQLSNVLALKTLGVGDSMQSLDPDAVSRWLHKPNPDRIVFPSDPGIFIDWLLEEEWHDTATLSQRLWQQVTFPAAVRQRLAHYPSLPQPQDRVPHLLR